MKRTFSFGTGRDMVLEIKEVLDQFQSWTESESRVRITKDGVSWLSRADTWNVGNDSILVDKEGEIGIVVIGNLGAADFRRVDCGIDALWPSGATIHFREESPPRTGRTSSLEKYLEHADELAQDVVNAWGSNVSAGNASKLTPDFKALFETACRYRTAKQIADNHREFGMLSEQWAAREKEAREAFARAYKDFREKHEAALKSREVN